MIAIPAIDIRQGACVQLVGGDYAQERVRRPDPVQVAVEWEQPGFPMLHVVDLDAATGRGSNAETVQAIISAVDVPVQVGGGVRTDKQIEYWLGRGAARVVVGTRALLELAWVEDAARTFPGRLTVAADVRSDRVLTHGWSRELPESLNEVLERLADLPLAGVLVTAVHKEGQVRGPDFELMRCCVSCGLPLIASGGVGSMSDLEELCILGAAGAVVGMALYTGALDARKVAERYGVSRAPASSRAKLGDNAS